MSIHTYIHTCTFAIITFKHGNIRKSRASDSVNLNTYTQNTTLAGVVIQLSYVHHIAMHPDTEFTIHRNFNTILCTYNIYREEVVNCTKTYIHTMYILYIHT